MYGLSLSWHWSVGTLIFLIVLSVLYLLGVRNAHLYVRRAIQDTQDAQDAPVKTRHILAFFSAIMIMAILLLTPIDTIARTQLFLAHMAQAVLLTTLCAPLILFACPASLLRPVIELPIVGSLIRLLTRPLVASITFNLLFLLWHTPRLYHLALIYGTLYHVELLSIFVAALLNWWPLIGSMRELHKMSYPMQMLYAFFDGQPVDIFAFVLVFTGTTIYPYYAIPAQLGISAFADQAAAGALLLVPGLVDLVVMSPLFFRWLGQIEQQTKIKDQRRQEQAAIEQEEYEEEYYEDDEEEVEERSKS